jgi:hypothetical protein
LPQGITNTQDFGCEQKILPPEVILDSVNTALGKSTVAIKGWF